MENKDLNNQDLNEEEISTENPEPEKHRWQKQKEEWYSHLNVTVKQLDTIIGLCVAGLIIVGILIVLDATGVF